MPSVGQVIGGRLRDAGVRYVVGHPGGEVVDLIEGFRAAGLEFVLTRHETSAGFMADAMAASTGVPGVCVATLGPGATNLVTGIAQAYLDRSPVLAFTGQLPMSRYEIVTHQKLDSRALYAPITKWQARVSASNAADVTDRALRVALSPRSGPVHLETPSDVPRQDTGEAARSFAMPTTRMPAIDAGAAGAAAQRLVRSARPLILAGMDANDGTTASRLIAFAEEWSIPVMDSPKSKGVFPEDHPLFLGTIEMLGTGRLYEEIEASDVVFMIGFDPVELDRDWPPRPEVVHLGPLPNDDRYYRSTVEVVGPVNEAIDAIRSLAGTPKPKRDAREIERFRSSFRMFVSPSRPGLTAQVVLRALRDVMPDDALATCDVGYNKAVTGQCWVARRPKTFFMSNGLSSMGYGLPAAIGLKLVHRDVPVACVLGDGGFAMTMAEIETAARLGLAVIVVVLADDALSQIKAGQERKGFAATGTTFGALDYPAIARGFGADGFDVRTEAECRAAFRDALSSRVPVLVAAHVDPTAYQLG
ncbi:MAG TPA: thiamine pyrophosphate-binding protein [Candidatus Limnocylindria bacterium]